MYTSEHFCSSIVMGLGKHGLQTLRFLRAFGSTLEVDPPLGEALKQGRIQTLGIDVVPNSHLEELTVEAKRMYLPGYAGPATISLPRLEKHCLHLDDTELGNTIARLNGRHGSGCEGGCTPFPSIESWFPPSLAEQWDGFQNKSQGSGVHQWRPLSRLLLFLNMMRVRETLEDVCNAYPGYLPDHLYLVCSLSDGVGSGMFLDLIHLAKLRMPSIKVTGLLVIEDQLSNTNGETNTYAALKEIVALNNFRDGRNIKRPSGLGSLINKPEYTGALFDQIFLFNAEATPTDAGPANSSDIDLCTYQIARCIQALSRTEIRKVMRQHTTTRAWNSPKGLPHCNGLFGTASACFFNLFTLPKIENHLIIAALNRHLRDLEDATQTMNFEAFGGRTGLDEWLTFHNTGRLDEIRKKAMKDAGREPLDKTRKTINDVREKLNSANPPRAISVFKEHFKEANWKRAIETPEKFMFLPLETDHIAEQIEQELKAKINPVIKAIGQLQLEGILFNADLGKHLDKVIQDLGSLAQKKAPDLTRVGLKIPYPSMLQNMADFNQKAGLRTEWKREVASHLSREDLLDSLQRAQFLAFLEDLEAALDHSEEPTWAGMGALAEWTLARCTQPLLTCLTRFKEHVEAGRADQQRANEQRNKTLQILNEHIRLLAGAPIEPKLLAQIKKALQQKIKKVGDLSWSQDLTTVMLEALPHVPITKTQLTEKLAEIAGTVNPKAFHILDPNPDLLDLFGKAMHTALGSIAWDEQEASPLIQNNYRLAHAIQDQVHQALLEMSGLPKDQSEMNALGLALPPVFAESHEQNSKKFRWAYVAPFGKNLGIGNDLEMNTRITGELTSYAKNELGAYKVLPEGTADTAAMMVLDLYRNPQEIEKIEHLFTAYQNCTNDGQTPYFHLDQAYVTLPDIILWQTKDKITCGNPPCTFSLNKQSRSLLMCPDCNNPIWNRCGNLNCKEDQLAKRFSWNGERKRIPRLCPACMGALKTYWWTCRRHHMNYQVPMDKTACPRCLEEVQKGIRNSSDVSTRENRQGQTCAGCTTAIDQPRERFTIPSELKRYVEKGVNGHDTVPFRKLANQHGLLGEEPTTSQCPKSSDIEAHALIPVCPLPDHPQHAYLYQTPSGAFVCNEHREARFWQCNHCQYPILADSGKTTCPRCLTLLDACTYCSHIHHRYYPIGTSNARCGHCHNFMAHQTNTGRAVVEAGLKKSAFCPNIYGCRAGSDIWLTATDSNLRTCRACPGPHAYLMPARELPAMVQGCPLCTLVLDSDFDPKKIVAVFRRFAELTPEQREGLCSICGAESMVILQWMRLSPLLEKGVEDDESLMALALDLESIETSHIPSMPIEQALVILRALHQEESPEEIVHNLAHTLGWRVLIRIQETTMMDLTRVFPPGGRTKTTLERRIPQLNAQTERFRLARDAFT